MSEIYETEKLLSEYLLFHYGEDDEILPPGTPWPGGMRAALGFPLRTVRKFGDERAERGLDLGCAVGRSAFAMAEICAEVIGIDYSYSFIAAARKLAAGEEIRYGRLEEGHRWTSLTARFASGFTGRVDFRQGDALALPEALGTFDRVHAANLLCRLREPQKLLRRLSALVNPGGLLVLATPCTWLEEYTPAEHWPEGATPSWLERELGSEFSLLETSDEPFLIRETARKFQWTRSLVTTWRRR